MRIAAMSGKFWEFIERFIDSEAKDGEAYASWGWLHNNITPLIKNLKQCNVSGWVRLGYCEPNMVRKENRLYNTVSIILKIQVVTWICQDLDTVLIKTL